MVRISFCITSIIVIILMASCNSTDDYTPIENDPLAELNLPNQYFNYANINLPQHLQVNAFPAQAQQRAAIEFDNTPLDNPISDAGATLGRVLFYDKKLSANGTISCASCHQQSHGFSDPEVFSVGFEGAVTDRHSMGLANARFYLTGKFFWDERAATLEDQVLMPFQDPIEMGLTLTQLVDIVEQQTYYPVLFQNAFGDPEITVERISKSLSQFVRSMVSTTSKYDIARNAEANPNVDFAGFTAQENLGKRLFFQPIPTTTGAPVSCVNCHASEAFVGSVPPGGAIGTTTATNNGLDRVSISDLGIFDTTGNPNDVGKFKAPSLKNIGVRPPYMHDGRFSTLEEVVEFYNSGVEGHLNLAPQLRDALGDPVRFNLTQSQKDALVAFLNTLTDYEMMNDEKYSDPFD